MKPRPIFRVWLSKQERMDSSPDIMVNAHGHVFSRANTGEVLHPELGVVMLNTGLERGDYTVKNFFYELDVVQCEESIGIVVMIDGMSRVWFGPEDIEFLDDIDVYFFCWYFNIIHDEKFSDFKEFAESFPLDKFFS